MSAPAVPSRAREQLREAWQALAAAEGSSPEDVDVVLGHPYLRTWAERCLRGLAEGERRIEQGDSCAGRDSRQTHDGISRWARSGPHA